MRCCHVNETHVAQLANQKIGLRKLNIKWRYRVLQSVVVLFRCSNFWESLSKRLNFCLDTVVCEQKSCSTKISEQSILKIFEILRTPWQFVKLYSVVNWLYYKYLNLYRTFTQSQKWTIFAVLPTNVLWRNEVRTTTKL